MLNVANQCDFISHFTNKIFWKFCQICNWVQLTHVTHSFVYPFMWQINIVSCIFHSPSVRCSQFLSRHVQTLFQCVFIPICLRLFDTECDKVLARNDLLCNWWFKSCFIRFRAFMCLFCYSISICITFSAMNILNN